MTVRLGELVRPDGTSAFKPDSVVGEGQGVQTAIRYMTDARPNGKNAPAAVAFGRPPSPGSEREEAYPSAAYRALAALRIWAAHQYLYPYRNLMGEDWGGVLKDFLPRFEAAKDELEYHLTVASMLAHVHDTHTGAHSKVLDAYYGEASAPVALRWIEAFPVVTRLLHRAAATAAGIAVGDTVLEIDGQDAATRCESYRRTPPRPPRRRSCGRCARVC